MVGNRSSGGRSCDDSMDDNSMVGNRSGGDSNLPSPQMHRSKLKNL